MLSFKYLVITLFLIIGSGLAVQAQFDVSTRSGRSNKEPLPQNVKESIEKQKIDESKKEYDELLQRGEEAVRLSEELTQSFAQNNKLTSKDLDRLRDLEKLLKRIRKDLGGDDDNDDEINFDKPDSIQNGLETLGQAALNLFEEIKKTTRFSISAVAIESSTALLKMVRFLRSFN